MKHISSQPAGKHTVQETAECERAVGSEPSGPRAHGRPTRARAEEIRSAILAAALAEFAERGFHGGNIVRIAERANVTRATVYNHFSSKEAIMEKIWEFSAHRLRSAIAEVTDMRRPVWEVLQDVGRCFYRDGLSAQAKSVSRILVLESDRFPDLVRKSYQQRWVALEPLSDYFAKLSMNGTMALDDAQRAAQQFMHLVTSSIDFLFADEARARAEQESWIASAVRIFLHGALRTP